MKEYELTQEEYDALMEASKPVTYMVVDGYEPSSPYENAMRVWDKVCARVRCRRDTITRGKDKMHFCASPDLDVQPVKGGE